MEEPGFQIGTTDIGERLWPFLGTKARRVVNTPINEAVLQFDLGADDKVYRLQSIWCKETQERPEQDYKRITRIVMSLNKVVQFAVETERLPDRFIRRFALTIDKLAEAEKIKYGILANPFTMPLAKVDDSHRLMVGLYCFSDYTREELNEWLGNEAFMEEGGLGTDDWIGLPE